jgi:hypothetical protein
VLNTPWPEFQSCSNNILGSEDASLLEEIGFNFQGDIRFCAFHVGPSVHPWSRIRDGSFLAPGFLNDIFEAEAANQEDDRHREQTTEGYSVEALEPRRSMVTVRHSQQANNCDYELLRERPFPKFGK